MLTTGTGSFVVGQTYSGSVYQGGGSVAVPYFRMSGGGGGNSSYTLAGGSLIMDYRLHPGGTGTWTADIGRAGATAQFVQTGGYVALINNYYLNVGYGTAGKGEFTMTNGSIFVDTQQFNIGGSGGQGTFTMSGGVVESRYKTQVGYRGNGVINQNGGSFIHGPNEAMTIGYCDDDASVTGPCVGIYNLNVGLLEVLGSRGPRIGNYASTTYGQGVGIVNVSGNALLLVDPDVRNGVMSVGYKSGQGTLTVSGGSVFSSSILVADQLQTSSTTLPVGVINVSGGSIEATTEFTVGRYGHGELNISGGSVVSATNNPTTSLRAGEKNAGADGVIRVSGSGKLSVISSLDLGYQVANGTLDVSGGVVSVGYNTNIGRETGAAGTVGRAMVNISGGSFQGNTVYVGYRGSYAPGVNAQLNITGGSFRSNSLYTLYQCKPGVGNQGSLKVGSDATVIVRDLFQIYAAGSSVEMEIASATKCSRIDTSGSVRSWVRTWRHWR